MQLSWHRRKIPATHWVCLCVCACLLLGPDAVLCVSVIDVGVRMVMLPAVQMSALTGGRARLAAAPQYISTLQPAVQNITGYRWPPANTYVMSLCLVMSSAVYVVWRWFSAVWYGVSSHCCDSQTCFSFALYFAINQCLFWFWFLENCENGSIWVFLQNIMNETKKASGILVFCVIYEKYCW